MRHARLPEAPVRGGLQTHRWYNKGTHLESICGVALCLSSKWLGKGKPKRCATCFMSRRSA